MSFVRTKPLCSLPFKYLHQQHHLPFYFQSFHIQKGLHMTLYDRFI